MKKLIFPGWLLLISYMFFTSSYAADPLHGVVTSLPSRAGDEAYLSGYSVRPHVIGSILTLNGSRLGTNKRQYKIVYLFTGEGRDYVKHTVPASYILSWTDTQIRLRTPYYIKQTGPYTLQLRKASRTYGQLNFYASLPTPRVFRYSTRNSCLGGNITIHGDNFTVHKGTFTLLIEARAPGNGSAFRGITINKSYIREWYNKRIKINLNRALSPYLQPGYTYRISLKKKLQSGYRTVAVGPTGILSRNCTSPSMNNSGSPVVVGQKTYVARFAGFTLNTRVILGNSVTFTGHLKASNAIADRQFRLHPMFVTFVIINKQTKVVVARKLITLKGRRVTFSITGIPKTTGQYILKPKVSGYGATGYRISHPGLLKSKATVINSPIRQLPVIYFRSSNPVRNSKVGQWLYFGGVFTIRDNAFYNRMKTIGFARINWSVVSITGSVAGRGTHRVTGKRSSLLIKVKPRTPGKYYLKLSLSGGNGVRFGLSHPNLKGIIVRVTRNLSYGRKPKY